LGEQILNIPTAGIVCAELAIRKWEYADWGRGKMLFFDFPKNKGD
jgi:phosphohistidine phosphatase